MPVARILQTITATTQRKGNTIAFVPKKESSALKECHVYWLHLESHTDITAEGYIGITTIGVEERYKRHLSAARGGVRKSRINNCINGYGDKIRVTTLLVSTQEYCQAIELKLRPAEKIGWNLCVGGSGTRAGAFNTPEHIAKASASNRGKVRSPSTVEQNRAKGLAQFTFKSPWHHPYSNKCAWANAHAIYKMCTEEGAGRRTLSRLLNIPVDSVSKVTVKIKAGWNPTTDSDYIAWLQQYKLKECNEGTLAA